MAHGVAYPKGVSFCPVDRKQTSEGCSRMGGGRVVSKVTEEG